MPCFLVVVLVSLDAQEPFRPLEVELLVKMTAIVIVKLLFEWNLIKGKYLISLFIESI